MKYFNYLFIAALAMLLCTACERNAGGTEPPATDESAYLVMFYGAAKYISNAFMNCEIVDANIQVKKENFPLSFVDRMNNDGVNDNPHDILQWLNTLYQDPDKIDEEIKGDWDIALVALCDMSENSFSLTDLLRNLDNSLIEVGAQNNPFGLLRQNLISALKKIAYIKSVTPQSHSGIDEEYELCSPGILIVPFASQLYSLELNARNNFAVSADMAKSSYQLTAFDRQIGWSRMLEMLDVFPSFLSNPTRAYVK